MDRRRVGPADAYGRGARRDGAVGRWADEGLAESVIIALGSAGAFKAVTDWWRLWLSRDHSRSIEITYTDGDRSKTVAVRGTNVSAEAFDEVTRAVTKSLER